MNPGGEGAPGLPGVMGSGIPLWSSWDTGDAQSSMSKLLILFSHSTGPERFPNRGDNPMVAVQLPSCVQLFATPRSAAHQASLSLTISRSLPEFMSIELVMSSNHLCYDNHKEACFYLFPGIVSLSQKLLWYMLFANRFGQIFYCSSIEVIYLHLWILKFSFIARNLWVSSYT